MTKHGLAGVHVTVGPRNGYGDWLYRAQEEPRFGFFVGEGGGAEEMLVANPDSITVFRTTVFGDGPQPLVGTPKEVAAWWMGRLLPVWNLNPSTYYSHTNEITPGETDGLLWWSAFDIHCMRIAEKDGKKLCIQNWSVGNPSDDGGISAEERYLALQDSWMYAAEYGHILGLHEYGLEGLMQNAGADLVLRYRRVLSWCRGKGIDIKIAITEAGANGGFEYPGNDEFVRDMAWYLSEVRKDKEVIGVAAWTLGKFHDANIQNGLSRYAQWIADNPAPTGIVVVPPPVVVVPPPVNVGLKQAVDDALLEEHRLRGVRFNPDAAIQMQIVADYGAAISIPVNEIDVAYDGKVYRAQSCQDLETGDLYSYAWRGATGVISLGIIE